MNTSKHTEGKWKMILAPNQVVTDDKIICDINHDLRTENVALHPLTYQEEAYANGRLIACAPELLEALKMATAWIENSCASMKYMPKGLGSIEDLRSVIKLAEGK